MMDDKGPAPMDVDQVTFKGKGKSWKGKPFKGKDMEARKVMEKA